jgi:hypothetical protein
MDQPPAKRLTSREAIIDVAWTVGELTHAVDELTTAVKSLREVAAGGAQASAETWAAMDKVLVDVKDGIENSFGNLATVLEGLGEDLN